ncbi:MAG: hypothetical protein J6D30_03870, partial [Clostridia bacterium]|nr:hypothetical protein [Clostridia bacterium]
YFQILTPLICAVVSFLILLCGAPLAKASEGSLIWESGKPFGDNLNLYKSTNLNIYNALEWSIYGGAVIFLLLISIIIIVLRHKRRAEVFDFVMIIPSIVALVIWIVAIATFDSGTVDYVSGGGISMEQGERNSLTMWYWIVMAALIIFNLFHFGLLKIRKNAK